MSGKSAKEDGVRVEVRVGLLERIRGLMRFERERRYGNVYDKEDGVSCGGVYSVDLLL